MTVEIGAAEFPFRLVHADSFDLLRAADVALCKSGTTTLEAAIVGDYAAVVALHDTIRALTRLFDIELVCVLDLDLPTRLEGDND